MAVNKTAAGCTFEQLLALGQVKMQLRLLDGSTIDLGDVETRVFSKGTWGFGLYGKSAIKVGGNTVRIQNSVNLVVVGSADCPPVGSSSPASTPAVIVPNGPAALFDPTTKQGTLFPSSEMARSIKAGCGQGFYSRCEVITESSPEWGVAKQTCSIELAKGVAML